MDALIGCGFEPVVEIGIDPFARGLLGYEGLFQKTAAAFDRRELVEGSRQPGGVKPGPDLAEVALDDESAVIRREAG